jgi:uncharacterized protein (TIGR00369 family)
MPETPSWPTNRADLTEMLEAAGSTTLPGHMGVEVIAIVEGRAQLRLEIAPHHLAPNGYLHAGAIITLADTAAGYGCIGSLPDGGTGFTTLEMKANFVGTLLEGSLTAEAVMAHGGRTTQVWDVTVSDESNGRRLALFRCTQLILYPPP